MTPPIADYSHAAPVEAAMILAGVCILAAIAVYLAGRR